MCVSPLVLMDRGSDVNETRRVAVGEAGEGGLRRGGAI